MLFFETSAKTGLNIDEVFVRSSGAIAEKIEKGEYDTSNDSCGIKIGITNDTAGKGNSGAVIRKINNGCNC